MENLDNIVNALDEFRIKNGTRWKSKLKELYFSGKNKFSWNNQFKISKISVIMLSS